MSTKKRFIVKKDTLTDEPKKWRVWDTVNHELVLGPTYRGLCLKTAKEWNTEEATKLSPEERRAQFRLIVCAA